MKVLFGTDILIRYLLKVDYIDGIRLLLKWLDKIGAKKIIDASSVAILTNFVSPTKIDQLHSFELLAMIPNLSLRSIEMRDEIPHLIPIEQPAAKALLAHLNLLDTNEVDYLVTESILMHSMAKMMGLDARVYTIENFIEKCTIENRDLDDSKGVIVRKCKFGELSIKDPFLSDFIKDYKPYFYNWFDKKKDDEVYISQDIQGNVKALLKLKYEYEDENYSDITPSFKPAKRLKICSFKIDYNGEKLGERFIRIIIEKAIENQVDEIYVTIFNNSKIRKRLVDLMERWGFEKWGVKRSSYKGKVEEVYCRKMNGVQFKDLKKDYPFHLEPTTSYIIPIHKIYCSQLLPEDTLINNDLDVIPSKHAIRKVLILHDYPKGIEKGSILLFYKLSSILDERYIIASGIVENIYTQFKDQQDFIIRCRKRSTLSNEELADCWQKTNKRPIVIEFLYLCSFDKDAITKDRLEELGIDTDSMHYQIPNPISTEQYHKLISDSKYERYINFN